jgi:excisionase family DNA binding protein
VAATSRTRTGDLLGAIETVMAGDEHDSRWPLGVRLQRMTAFPRFRGSDDAERLLRAGDVADRTGLSYHAVLRAIHRGELPAFRLCGRIRIRPSDLEKWMDERRIERHGESLPSSPLFGVPAEPQRGTFAALRALEPGARRT